MVVSRHASVSRYPSLPCCLHWHAICPVCIHVHLAMFMWYSAIHAILLVGRVYLQKDAIDQLLHRFVCQNSLNQPSRADT